MSRKIAWPASFLPLLQKHGSPRAALVALINEHEGSIPDAARALGIPPSTPYYWVAKYRVRLVRVAQRKERSS